MKRAVAGALRVAASGAIKLITLPARALNSARRSVGGGTSGGMGVDAWAVVGLGNPGKKFDGTKHNVGFDVVDELARREGIPMVNSKCRAIIGVGKIGHTPVVLAKPQTFMNLSGKSVRDVMRTYRIPKSRILIVYDDLDTKIAELRVKVSGSHGGHNGVRSVIDDATGGAKDFPRVKVGIGRPSDDSVPIYEYVLSRFEEDDRKNIDIAVSDAVDVVREVLVDQNLDNAMTRCNTKYAPKKVKAQKKPKQPKERIFVSAVVDDNENVTLSLAVKSQGQTNKPKENGMAAPPNHA